MFEFIIKKNIFLLMDTILTTTLNDDRLGSLGRKSNADNIFRIIKNGVTRATLDNNYIFNYLVRE
jgi:hypothetical protein